MRALAGLLAIFCTLRIAAADSPAVMFILDGSGSMWGQIEGRAKIEIAKEVMTGLVDELPPEANTGLAVYGHRRKGDCEDIEILSGIDSDDRAALKRQIAAINPRGKTPITRSLQLAAETLRTVEEETTLVLISDGEETCGGDPCALVDQLVDQGLKVRVHVVGFDVRQEERDQLMCIADAGNGNYFTADSADQLGEALAEVKEEVVRKVQQASAAETTFVAVAEDDGTPLDGDVEWTVINSATEQVWVVDDQGAQLKLKLGPGPYEVFAVAGTATGEGVFEVTGEPGARFEIPLSIEREARPFDVPASVPAGAPLKFNWRGPNAKGDLIFIASPGMDDNRYPLSNRHQTKDGPTASLVVPARPGNYEIRYFSMANGAVLHRMPLEVTPPQGAIEAPESIPAGTPFRLTWSGPNAPGDLLFIASPNMDAGKYWLTNNHKTSDGATAAMTAPAQPGAYEIRYYSNGNGTVLFRKPLTVTAPEVTLDAPRTASAGTPITVDWAGPKAKGDMIFIAKPSLAANKYWTRNHPTSKGSPAVLTAPAEPGTYEIRYYSAPNGTVLAKRALIVR